MSSLKQALSAPFLQSPSMLEVAAGFDGLTSLDELAPGMSWDELLSATWGLPSPKADRPAVQPLFATVLGWLGLTVCQ
jgi:hypothetical protein